MKNLLLLAILITTSVQASDLECIKEEAMRGNGKEVVTVTISNSTTNGIFEVSYSKCFEEMSGETFCDEEVYGGSFSVNKDFLEIFRVDDLKIINYLDQEVSVYRNGNLLVNDLKCSKKQQDANAGAYQEGDIE